MMTSARESSAILRITQSNLIGKIGQELLQESSASAKIFKEGLFSVV